MFVPMRLTEEQEKALDIIQNENELKKMKEACVSAIMVLGQNRNPIKKADLNRLVLSGTRHYRAVNALTIQANKDLHRIFGMRLYELEDKSKYLLVNSSSDYSLYPKRSGAQYDEFSVLFFTLIDIFASPEEKISESDMMKTLKALELSDKDLRKHIDSMLKRLYIVQVKDPMHQDTKFYAWGPRAEAEIDPDKFFDSFLSLTSDANKSHWPEQQRRIDNLKSIQNRNIA